MDKITTALTATEDNAAAIRALGNKLREQSEKNDAQLDKLNDKLDTLTLNRLVVGTTLTANGVSLGEVESNGAVCVLLSFDDTAQRRIYYCKQLIATTISPAFLVLPKGKGELLVYGPAPVSALILGSRTMSYRR